MKDWFGGSHSVLEGRKDNIDLIGIGYKYNNRKVISFIATKGNGHIEAGISYKAKWEKNNGAKMVRRVARLQMVSTYFKNLNIIDKGNQSRQYSLRLENIGLLMMIFFNQ